MKNSDKEVTVKNPCYPKNLNYEYTYIKKKGYEICDNLFYNTVPHCKAVIEGDFDESRCYDLLNQVVTTKHIIENYTLESPFDLNSSFMSVFKSHVNVRIATVFTR